MTLTTTQFASEFADGLEAQGLDLANKPAFVAAFAGQLTGWLGGEGAIPADLAYRLMQAIGAINTDALQRLDWWTGTATGGPNGDGLYPMTNAAGVTTLFPSLAKILQATAKGDPGGVSYVFAAATADADPGAGRVRFNHATIATVTKLFYDTASATGGDLTAWFASFGLSSSAVKGLLVLQAGSAAPPLVFRVSGAPVARVGYYEIPVAYVAGPAVPADGASVTSVFMQTGDKGDSVRSGVGAPGAGSGVNGDIYLRLDTGDWYGPKAAGAWGGPIAQTEVAALLAQAIAARNATLTARDIVLTASGVASDAAGAAIDARDIAAEKAGEAAGDRADVAADKADVATWLEAFGLQKAQFGAWLDQLAIDQPIVVAAAATALAEAGRARDEADRAELLADSLDSVLINARVDGLYAQTQSDLVRVFLGLADLRSNLFGTPNGIADSFGTTAGIDLAATTCAKLVAGSYTQDYLLTGMESVESLPAMTSDASPSGHTAVASSQYAGTTPADLHAAYRAFDGEAASAAWQANVAAPGWIRRGRTAAMVVSRYRLYTWTTFGARMPITWTFEGATSSSGPWTVLDTRTAQPAWSNSEMREFTFLNTTAFNFYRVNIAAVTSGQPIIGRIELLQGSVTLGPMDLRSISFEAASSPSKAYLALIAQGDVGIVPNADLKGYVSRDGGVTWKLATLVARETAGGFTHYEAADVDLSTLPAGTSLRWRAYAAPSPAIRIASASLKWN